MAADPRFLSEVHPDPVSASAETSRDGLPGYFQNTQHPDGRMLNPPRYSFIIGGRKPTVISKFDITLEGQHAPSPSAHTHEAEHTTEQLSQSTTSTLLALPQSQASSPIVVEKPSRSSISMSSMISQSRAPSQSSSRFDGSSSGNPVPSSVFHLWDKLGKPSVSLEIFGRKNAKGKPILYPGEYIEGRVLLDSQKGSPSSIIVEVSCSLSYALSI
jgi:hypothetical protein